MIKSSQDSYDVAIVGGGPVGSICALAHARKGQKVALFERNPKAASRLAGEWLHPPAVRILKNLGIEPSDPKQTAVGKGFVVYPEDGTEPMVLPYPGDTMGLTYEHSALVSDLHLALAVEPHVDFYQRSRVRSVSNHCLELSKDGQRSTIQAKRIVGADGRASVVRQALGLDSKRLTCSRMIGVLLEDAKLPFENFGHVLLGGPGPVFMFPLGGERIRIIMDIPIDHWAPRDRLGLLLDSYADLLPESIRDVFEDTVRPGNFQAATNELRPRVTYGNDQQILIGDAAGHYHPLTAVGLTLGLGEADLLASSESIKKYTKRCLRLARAPEFLALGLYEVFADHRPEAAALRQSVYKNWREKQSVRDKTMSLLACEDVSLASLSGTFFKVVIGSVLSLVPKSSQRIQWSHIRHITHHLRVRIGSFLRGVFALRSKRKNNQERDRKSKEHFARAFLLSMDSMNGDSEDAINPQVEEVRLAQAVSHATTHLLSLQREDGGWEGEMVWCPMLIAQYVLLHHMMGRPISADRKRLILMQFKRTQLEDGTWGMHEHSSAYLFVTTLVFVAARLLGVSCDDPLLKRATEFIRREGVENIPSWGKFWLSLMNLYEWEGLNAVLPELWALPQWLPMHPSKWYCHTRLIYMSMATIYATRFQTPVNSTINAIRNELYPNGFSIDFERCRNKLREEDLFARPTRILRLGFILGNFYQRVHSKRIRRRCVVDLINRVRWELDTSSHTSISPVSGFLNILSLWLRDPNDQDVTKAVEKLEDWIWEDECAGTRVTGARSASWDTGFATQALATISDIEGVSESLDRGAAFLRTQQIRESFPGFERAFRADARGGWCFAGIWHGWPVSDCTAEAILGILASSSVSDDIDRLREAIQFILRAQNKDGSFGSYECRRSALKLEWMNPAEMFGESMTEVSYVECTASSLSALAACRERYPELIDDQVDMAIERASQWLRDSQNTDGSWRGVWGVQYIYGTFFGIRGLLAAGATPGDPAVRLARRWLLDQQNPDGGWGEHYSGCMTGEYVPSESSQVIQTAWSLIALLESHESDWQALSRGIQYLLNLQEADGGWPKQEMAGVFFRSALLDYVLYREYFPLHALGLFQNRLKTRQEFSRTSSPEKSDLVEVAV